MTHPLYLAVAKTRGMRQLAALRAQALVRDALGPRVGVSSRLQGNRLEVSFSLPLRAWWWFGLKHFWSWLRARGALRRALRECKTDVVLRKVRPWRRNIPTSPNS